MTGFTVEIILEAEKECRAIGSAVVELRRRLQTLDLDDVAFLADFRLQ